MVENPKKVLKTLRLVEKRIRRAQRDIVGLGWRIQTFRKLFELKLVPLMSISQNEELYQFSATLNTILIHIQTIVIGVDALESQTLGIALNAEKDLKQKRTPENERP